MTTPDKAVREAAKALAEAIQTAKTAGYVTTWPRTADGLPFIAISETAKAQNVKAAPIAPKEPKRAPAASKSVGKPKP